MKKIIITTNQLRKINEEFTVDVNTGAKANADAYATKLKSGDTLRDIQNAKKYSPDVNAYVSSDKTTDGMPVIDKNIQQGQQISFTPEEQKAIADGSPAKIHGDGFGGTNESRVFTKKFIEESRLRKMRDEGTVTKKKDLFEMVSPFTDGDYASTGDPYDLVDDEEDNSLNGGYSFNTIWVDIKGDGTENPNIKVTSRKYRDSKEFNGPEAQKILDAINNDIEKCGGLHQSIYKNLYRYVS